MSNLVQAPLGFGHRSIVGGESEAAAIDDDQR
jgi:hypothetical protein